MTTKYITGLADTVEFMNDADYKHRFVAEYLQTKIRYDKLKSFCNKIEAAQTTRVSLVGFGHIEEPKHDCPLDLLRAQQRAMGEYLSILEIRAVIENVDLGNLEYELERED